MTASDHYLPDNGQRANQKRAANALRNRFTNCANKLHNSFNQKRKTAGNDFLAGVQAHVFLLSLYTRQALPLSRAKVLRLAHGSPQLARSPVRQSRDVRKPSGKTTDKMSRGLSTQYSGSGWIAATAMPPSGQQIDSQDNLPVAKKQRGMISPDTGEMTRHLATQGSRSSHAAVGATTRATSCEQLVGFSSPAFSHDIQKL